MIEVVDITESDIELLTMYVPVDVLENVARESCFGVMAMGEEDAVLGSLFWCLNDSEEEETYSEIFFFDANSREVGDALLEAYGTRAVADAVIRTHIEIEPPQEVVRQSVEAAGFTMEEGEGKDVFISVSELTKMKSLIGNGRVPPYVYKIENIRGVELFQGIANCMFHGFNGVYEDIDSIPTGWYEPEVSCCVKTDGKVNGLFLIHPCPSGKLMPVLFACVGPGSQKSLAYMLRYTLLAIMVDYPPETKILIRRHENRVKALTDNFFPDKTGETRYKGDRDEARG